MPERRKKRRITREEWLHLARAELEPEFTRIGFPLPSNIRLSVGFPTGSITKRVAQAFHFTRSKDGHYELFHSPVLPDTEEMIHALAHELTHIAAGFECGHTKGFRVCMEALGYTRPMRSSPAGPAARKRAAAIIDKIGEIPHAQLVVTPDSRMRPEPDADPGNQGDEDEYDGPADTRPIRDKGGRLIKCVCRVCGYPAHTTRVWISKSGPPVCPEPDHGPMMIQAKPDDPAA